jgi:ABC-type molybdenum transport system ATPase subunit/photorepair protein PhrA
MGEIDEQKLRKTSQVLGVEKLLDGSLMNLSNGQQRRARIVKALLHDPEILLLEEPYSIVHFTHSLTDSGIGCFFPKNLVNSAFKSGRGLIA